MSLYPKFDPDLYLQKYKDEADKVANPAKEPESTSENLASLAELADPLPDSANVTELETDSDERAAICEFDGQIPREWAEGFAELQAMPPPASIS
jgi:hypothetical protein